MRAVRCDVCGAKAMTAAAKCPSCGHLFQLRDGFGELVPLAYCSSCESYYPESAGECRWCGTKPERAPMAPQIWRGVGVAALVVIVGGMWVVRSKTPPDVGHARPKTPVASAPATTDTTAPRIVVASVSPDSVVRDSGVAAGVMSDAAPNPAPVAIPAQQSVAQPTVPQASPSRKSAATASSHTRRSSWVRSYSRHWVVIRSDASRQSRIVASIGPNSRVELGESRGTWRRIRAKGLSGWVEPRSSFEVAAR
jgi:ribosomal protein L40E